LKSRRSGVRPGKLVLKTAGAFVSTSVAQRLRRLANTPKGRKAAGAAVFAGGLGLVHLGLEVPEMFEPSRLASALEWGLHGVGVNLAFSAMTTRGGPKRLGRALLYSLGAGLGSATAGFAHPSGSLLWRGPVTALGALGNVAGSAKIAWDIAVAYRPNLKF
jgi:hypothetical protein